MKIRTYALEIKSATTKVIIKEFRLKSCIFPFPNNITSVSTANSEFIIELKQKFSEEENANIIHNIYNR